MNDGYTRIIALIPARGGSKGILRKNLALLAGKPLIAYTIEAARSATLIDEIWVSSEDEEIIKVSESFGVKTLLRPKDLADDSASADGVVFHFINSLPNSAQHHEYILVYLQPTSPLRDGTHIDQALQAMVKSEAAGVVSVVEADKPPQKAFVLDENGYLKSLFNERLSNERRQDLPRCYYPNGAIYAFRISAFLARNGFPSNGSIPFIMSSTDSIDIDNLADLTRAEIAIGEKNG